MTLSTAWLALIPWIAAQQGGALAFEPDGDSGSPSVSDDGELVVFASRASNFVVDDEKDTWDVFLHERSTGRVTRISDRGNLPARSPRISGDGRWIVYYQAQPARATANGSWHSTEVPWSVVLVEREHRWARVLGDATPTTEDWDPAAAPSIARDGRRVAFPIGAC